MLLVVLLTSLIVLLTSQIFALSEVLGPLLGFVAVIPVAAATTGCPSDCV